MLSFAALATVVINEHSHLVHVCLLHWIVEAATVLPPHIGSAVGSRGHGPSGHSGKQEGSGGPMLRLSACKLLMTIIL